MVFDRLYKSLWFLQWTLFTLLHETEAKTECDHITPNFECHNGSFLQIAIWKEVKMPKRGFCQVFLNDRKLGPHGKKVHFIYTYINIWAILKYHRKRGPTM